MNAVTLLTILLQGSVATAVGAVAFRSVRVR
jgi:hypothetical protein